MNFNKIAALGALAAVLATPFAQAQWDCGPYTLGYYGYGPNNGVVMVHRYVQGKAVEEYTLQQVRTLIPLTEKHSVTTDDGITVKATIAPFNTHISVNDESFDCVDPNPFR